VNPLVSAIVLVHSPISGLHKANGNPAPETGELKMNQNGGTDYCDLAGERPSPAAARYDSERAWKIPYAPQSASIAAPVPGRSPLAVPKIHSLHLHSKELARSGRSVCIWRSRVVRRPGSGHVTGLEQSSLRPSHDDIRADFLNGQRNRRH
jgi:hypothetical protein